jgi:hypothetical protein
MTTNDPPGIPFARVCFVAHQYGYAPVPAEACANKAVSVVAHE